jgi:hypothetical protein
MIPANALTIVRAIVKVIEGVAVPPILSAGTFKNDVAHKLDVPIEISCGTLTNDVGAQMNQISFRPDKAF